MNAWAAFFLGALVGPPMWGLLLWALGVGVSIDIGGGAE